jgi:hypothetical protein
MRKIVSANAFRAGWAACERAYIGAGTLFAQARQGRAFPRLGRSGGAA